MSCMTAPCKNPVADAFQNKVSSWPDVVTRCFCEEKSAYVYRRLPPPGEVTPVRLPIMYCLLHTSYEANLSDEMD